MHLMELRDVVTHFSEELRFKSEPMQEVTVAGKVIAVNQINDECYQVTLDDYIGLTRVLLSTDTYLHFQSILKDNHFVSVQGYVNKVTRSIQREKETQISVVGYNVKLLTF